MKYLPLLLCFLPAFSSFSQNADSIFTAEITQHRQQYKQNFLNGERSPLTAADTALLDFFKPNTAWRVKAQFERTPAAQPFEMPTYSDRTARYQQYGVLIFEKNGKKDTLCIYQNLRLLNLQKYQDYLFLPFKDATNGDASYGGGRYLDFRQGDISAENVLFIDFNKAYNPWCAYSDGYNCPIPPKGNHLDVAVEAGEKNFKGEKKH